MTRRTFVLPITALLLVLPAFAAAQAPEGFELYVAPATPEAESIWTLFNVTFWMAMVIFVGVEAFLFFVIWKFRRNKVTPEGETHRGHTPAEVAWTVIPAVILLGIGIASAQTLFVLDAPPEGGADFAVRVEASQFLWKFEYPDGSSTFNELRVASGSKVQLDVTSRDVIHAVYIPSFALKLDAYPGRLNHQWFQAPEVGAYFMQCAEYCGVGHHDMQARITVFDPASQPTPYGRPPAAPAPEPGTNATNETNETA